MATRGPIPLRLVAAALCLAAALLLSPLWMPLVLAAWAADVLRPAQRRLERILRGHRRGAAAVVVLLALAVLLPMTGVALAVASEAHDVLEQVRDALMGKGSLGGALLGGAGDSAPDWVALATRYGANAWRAATTLARASARAAIATVVFVFALYTFLTEGPRAWAWVEARAPGSRHALRRLAAAFRETGRGLIVAGGGTALVQGAFATAAYVAIGIPRALILGPLTAVSAIVPAVGTSLVWVPLAIELAVTGDRGRAALTVAAGGLTSIIDNFVRPVLARHGRLALPTFVVLISMLGGVAVMGATGALLGPLVVRLAVEAIEIVTEDASPPPDAHPRPPDDVHDVRAETEHRAPE
jgi:predicted PurR-regulated permease PerM